MTVRVFALVWVFLLLLYAVVMMVTLPRATMGGQLAIWIFGDECGQPFTPACGWTTR